MTVTIKQIARHAGLSIPTVSRILNNDSEFFRPETKEKVLKAARELGYRPNSYRMALRTKRFNAIGLLLGTRQLEDTITAGILRVLLAELHGRNQHLLVGEVRTEHGVVDAPKMLREWSVDGMLMHCDGRPRGAIDQLIEENKIPAIWLGARREADCVYPDDGAGVADATERLIHLGHRQIVFINLGATDPAARRRGGYESVMKDAGAEPQVVAPRHEVLQRDRLDFCLEWLRTHRPTAAICCGRGEAASLFAASLASGMSVPKDLSIVAVHDEPVDDTGARITTMCLPGSEMAIQALAALADKIADPSRAVPCRALPLSYYEGVTLAPPGGD